MPNAAPLPNRETSECRALVPVAAPRAAAVSPQIRTDAAFLAQLGASLRGAAIYRVRRRAEPREASRSYRTGAAQGSAVSPRTLAWI
jgi:hypothetical protein